MSRRSASNQRGSANTKSDKKRPQKYAHLKDLDDITFGLVKMLEEDFCRDAPLKASAILQLMHGNDPLRYYRRLMTLDGFKISGKDFVRRYREEKKRLWADLDKKFESLSDEIKTRVRIVEDRAREGSLYLQANQVLDKLFDVYEDEKAGTTTLRARGADGQPDENMQMADFNDKACREIHREFKYPLQQCGHRSFLICLVYAHTEVIEWITKEFIPKVEPKHGFVYRLDQDTIHKRAMVALSYAMVCKPEHIDYITLEFSPDAPSLAGEAGEEAEAEVDKEKTEELVEATTINDGMMDKLRDGLKSGEIDMLDVLEGMGNGGGEGEEEEEEE